MQVLLHPLEPIEQEDPFPYPGPRRPPRRLHITLDCAPVNSYILPAFIHKWNRVDEEVEGLLIIFEVI